jgi:Ig domain of plant-specific actin-binding protein
MGGQRRSRAFIGRLVCIACCGVAGLLLHAGSARANHYDVYACYAGQGTYLNPSSSAVSMQFTDNNSGTRYLAYDQCGQTASGIGAISRSGFAASSGQEAQVSFTAPSPLHVERAQLWRALYDYGVGTGATSQRGDAGTFADGSPVGEFFDGTQDVPHASVGADGQPKNGIVPGNLVDISLASALPQTFSYRIGCDFSSCTTGGHDPASPSGPDEEIHIFGAIFSVRDDTPPTLSLADTGLLAGGRQRGTVPLTLTAAAIPGISRLEIYANGASAPAIVQDFTQTTHCSFWLAAPCQNLSGYQWPIDTTQLPDGTYYVTVKAYDPANNVVAQASASQVTIDNAPPPSLAPGHAPTISGTPVVGGTLQASPGQWYGANMTFAYQWQHCAADGSACASISGAADSAYTPAANDQGRALRVLVTATNPEGSSTAGSAATAAVAPSTAGAPNAQGLPTAGAGSTNVGAANGAGASDRAQFANASHRYMTVGFGKPLVLSGRLTDGAGAPISMATVTVLTRVVGTSTWRLLGNVATGSDGSYSVTIPPGPSRLVRVAYRSHAGDAQYTSTDDTLENVLAAARLRTLPSHVRNHQRVIFRGQLLGGHVPLGGKAVEIQVLVGRRWQDVVGARSDARGRFQTSYRFMRTFLTITYTFRAVVRQESGYPFTLGTSNPAQVRVN